MVVEPWIHRMQTTLFLQNYYSSSSSIVDGPRKKKEGSKPLQDGEDTVGILCFEVANSMSQAINLYRSVSDSEIAGLLSQTLTSPAVHLLVSTNEPYLLVLALVETLDDLNHIATVASRLGRCCSHPALRGFEHIYFDILVGRIDPTSLGSLSKDMDGTVRKMEHFVSSTATLYIELEVLTQLEHLTKKCPPTPVHDKTRRAVKQKIQWQRSKGGARRSEVVEDRGHLWKEDGTHGGPLIEEVEDVLEGGGYGGRAREGRLGPQGGGGVAARDSTPRQPHGGLDGEGSTGRARARGRAGWRGQAGEKASEAEGGGGDRRWRGGGGERAEKRVGSTFRF